MSYADSATETSPQGSVDRNLQSTSILDDLVIRTRRGSDDVTLDTVDVGDDLVVELGDRDDTLDLVDVNVLDDATLLLGEGENAVAIEDTSIGDDLRITGGHAESGDSIQIRNTDVGDLFQIYAHDGDDAVCIDEMEAGRVHVHMGHGNDRLDLRSVDVAVTTELNGDDGFDTLGEEDNSLNGLSLRTFEQFDDFVDCDE